MTKHKTEAKKANGQHVRLFLSVADHRALRIAAAKAGLSMAEFARQAVVIAAEDANRLYDKS